MKYHLADIRMIRADRARHLLRNLPNLAVSDSLDAIVAVVERAVEERRWETARRICLGALSAQPGNPQLLTLLHSAYRLLGDQQGCRWALDQIRPQTPADELSLLLLRAVDEYRESDHGFYRTSAEQAAGYTYEEYQAKKLAESRRLLDEAERRASTAEERRQVAAALRECGYIEEADALYRPPPTQPAARRRTTTTTGSLAGTLRFPDGSPVAGATVTLGLITADVPPPEVPLVHQPMHYHPPIEEVEARTTTTDAHGGYAFPDVPAGEHAFLAVMLDPEQYDLPTRFFAHRPRVEAGRMQTIDATIDDWRSAPPVAPAASIPERLEIGGVAYRRVWQHRFHNPFHYTFPRQAVMIPLPDGVPADTARLRLIDSRIPSEPVAIQICGRELVFLHDLPEMSEHVLGLYVTDVPVDAPALPSMLVLADSHEAVIDTGAARFFVPWDEGSDALPPVLAVQGPDGIRRGQGRLILPADVTVRRRTTEVLDDGPVLLRVCINYELSNASRYTLTFAAHRGEPYLLVHEVSPELEGARFEFSLREFGSGRGRGYLHWKTHEASQNWSTLEAVDREVARLQESVPWWIPPAGFACALTPDGLDQRDFIAVCTLRRGDWIDRKFDRIAHGPGDEPPWRRELDWPFPEMVGSTISMITAHTDDTGDAFFRFPLFDGERHWGLYVSSLDRNDGLITELSAVQHKNSSPTIQQFMTWHLDEQDTVERPHVVARRDQLRHLRHKRRQPAFAGLYQKMVDNQGKHGTVDALRFAVEADPLLAWRKKAELVGVAHVRARMTLMGREYSDMYSPVGSRPITQWAESYDLIAPSGVFTPEEERLVRAFLILMGHLYLSPDLMNWKHGSRNANFEADRVDVVGTIGVVFRGHPDATTFTDHAIALMEQSLATYTTPGSGKWYENPACYYLHASKCRMNLLVHLANAGLFEPTTLPRLKEYLRWGILLLTPPCPMAHDVMRDGCSDGEYGAVHKVRRIAPIGDHAQLGPWAPEHYALAAKLYRKTDPAFADELMWAYQSGGADGAYYGNLPPLFARLEEEDLQPVPAPTLTSRRLEGFGAVFRSHFNTPREAFVLFKQGPGGYRFHRTEGSIILFADGKPLIYDGGEAGETWRHSTLSFHDVHMPLSAGHVERFAAFDGLGFCQGVHPVVLRPGEPVFLSDVCWHHLVDEAIRRYHEPNPADVRSIWWIRDRYLIVHDALAVDPSILTWWHLQVVADSHSGDWRTGYRFRGRFGTDLYVLMPDQTFVDEQVIQQPILDYKRKAEESFSMRHLQLRAASNQHYLAILQPLRPDEQPLTASSIMHDGSLIGTHVRGDGIDDLFLFARSDIELTQGDLHFAGRYAAIQRDANQTALTLLAGTRLTWQGIDLRTTGTMAHLLLTKDNATLTIEGEGRCQITGPGSSADLSTPGPRQTILIPRTTPLS